MKSRFWFMKRCKIGFLPYQVLRQWLFLLCNDNFEIFIKNLPRRFYMESGWKNRLGRSGDLRGSNSICLRSSVGMIRDVADPGMDHSRACSICFGRRPIFDRKSVLKPECQAGIARPFCAFWGRHGRLQRPSQMSRSAWSLRSGADLLHKKTHNTDIVSLV